MWKLFVDFLTNILLFLTNATGNLGTGIILFTIATRVVMFPLTWKQLKSSKKMQELQPLMAELRRKYGKDQEKLTQEMTKLYRDQQVNPVGGCLPLVIQMPIFIGVYQAIRALVSVNHGLAPSALSFLWIPDLRDFDHLFILPVLTIVLQLLSSVMAMPKIQDPQQKATSQTMLIMPIIFGVIYIKFNAGSVLYWAAGAVLQLIQQFFVTGWGSLTNYLPFLPERNGFLTPTHQPGATTVIDAEPEPEAPVANFWGPLQKLQTSPALSADDEATDRAINEAKQQGRQRKRR